MHKTLNIIRGLTSDLDVEEEYPEQKKLRKALGKLKTYLDNNRGYIPNYGDRRRHNEPISTWFGESGVTQVMSKRFVKKQEMRWTKRGAHLLLQIRTKVLNQAWREKVTNWYPVTANGVESQSLAA